ncbi:hypothetical protein BDEG_20310 [Batrachochytrium dendrobatidis JEL423]|uniref:Uncharacterized protein n=1 Tax=Batrachochytrium dendrobatidis (strain JEL423) TaxID=403673 RepID=A0A177W7M6_BATDL|nr:hypothetical protein BDEG_20310 [Batrachochytrium dendrobatidis JEL423]
MVVPKEKEKERLLRNSQFLTEKHNEYLTIVYLQAKEAVSVQDKYKKYSILRECFRLKSQLESEKQCPTALSNQSTARANSAKFTAYFQNQLCYISSVGYKRLPKRRGNTLQNIANFAMHTLEKQGTSKNKV